jgi:glyoxylate reductase
MKLVITRRVFRELVERLRDSFEVVDNEEDRPWPPEELAANLAGASGAMATVMDRFDESILAKCPELKVISNIAVGYNNIDVAACTKRGIRVTNTPGVLDDTTADLTWSLLMSAARRIAEADAYVRRGDWKIAFGVQYFLGQDIHHATLGIIGMGRIGQAVARRARGFDMRVLYHNRSRLDGATEKALGAKWVEREALLAQSDFVVVMAPYSSATHHLIGAAEIAKMKPTAILVNTARGGVVDDAALVAALKEKRIAGAGLDVFEGEP